MNERQPYTYVLLRYRHDPLAGEFANVGAEFIAAQLKTRRDAIKAAIGA